MKIFKGIIGFFCGIAAVVLGIVLLYWLIIALDLMFIGIIL